MRAPTFANTFETSTNVDELRRIVWPDRVRSSADGRLDRTSRVATAKAFDVLTLLVQHRERVVSKEELLTSVWPDTFVEEANLTQHIFELRRTLNGNVTPPRHEIPSRDGETAEYITTVPRRGYRFTATVVERTENERPTPVAQPQVSPRRWSWLALSVAAATVLAAIAVVRLRESADLEPRVRPVTALPGLERSPSLSPDGNFVVFSWTGEDPQGVPDLWIKAADGNSDVYVVPLDGGRPRQITDHASFDGLSDWSSDGHWIFFTSTRSGTAEVWKVPADGGDPTRLTYKGGLQPRAAPDGGTLFYLDRSPAGVGGTSGTGKLMSVPIVGGEETVVLDGIRLALWSVVETGIVFLTIETSGDAIDFYRFSDRMVRRLGTLPFRVCRSAGLGALTVSPDGRLALVSVTDAWESDIVIAEGVR